MKNPTAVFLILGLVVGFWAGSYWSQQKETTYTVQELPEDPPAPVICAPAPPWTHINGITPEEVREYLRIENAEQKLKRADAILGKIIQALIADIGFKLSPNEMAQFGKLPPVEKPADNQPLPSPPPQTLKKQLEAEKLLSKAKLEIRNATSAEQALRALQDLGSDFSQSLAQSGSLTATQIRLLNGQFEGTIQYSDGRVARLTLQFSGRSRGGKLEGHAHVQIYTADGKVNSAGTSEGDLSQSYSGNENAVFVQVGNAYLELVYFTAMDLWMGNYLESSKGQLNKTGIISLQRK